MRSSAALVVVTCGAAAIALLAACNAVLGLGDYSEIACVNNCEAGVDAAQADAAPSPDAAPDTSIDVEAGAYDPGRAWASWPMPNPVDDGGYPNPPSYDAGGDSGVVFDDQTKLQWENQTTPPPPPANVGNAQVYCSMLAANGYAGFHDWRLPTRIELVTLIDYTRTSGATIAPIFASTPADLFWTASPFAGDAGTWGIDFSTGEVKNVGARPSANVRCVRAGKPR